MLVEEMTADACSDLLTHARLGRIACAQGSQPYVVPFYFAYYHGCLYSFSTVGQKIEWMRANALVCVEVDEVISPHQWESVVVFGQYEELLDTPGFQGDRALAHKLLQRYATWWEPGYAKTIIRDRERPLEPIFYRIHVGQVTGHRATVESALSVQRQLSMTDASEARMLQRLVRLVQSRFRRLSL